jgi:hypothetical protein
MNMQLLKAAAHRAGVVNMDGIDKEQDFVRSIQIATGHRPCFQSEHKYLCKKYDCEWRKDCTKLVAEWMR